MAKFSRRLHRSRGLRRGERVEHAVRLVVTPAGVGVTELPAMRAMASDKASEIAAMGFPASVRMIAAVTDRRLIVFRRAGFGKRPRYIGEVPIRELGRVEVRPGLNKSLVFFFRDGRVVDFVAYRTDRPERFVDAVNRLVAANPPPAPGARRRAPIPPAPPF